MLDEVFKNRGDLPDPLLVQCATNLVCQFGQSLLLIRPGVEVRGDQSEKLQLIDDDSTLLIHDLGSPVPRLNELGNIVASVRRLFKESG